MRRQARSNELRKMSHTLEQSGTATVLNSLTESRTVRVDKIASATVRIGLDREIAVTSQLPPGRAPLAGDVVVVRAITDNPSYNALELVSGRTAKVTPGDVIAGVLGRRRALKGFVGDVPHAAAAGDRLHLLNLGGVIGCSSGHHHSFSEAIEVELIGFAQRDGAIINIADGALEPRDSLDITVPLILVAGTCMTSGKTYAATSIIKHLSRAGLRVAGAKLSGVACLRDTLNMEDHGAIEALSFLDAGLASTAGVDDLPRFAKGVLSRLAEIEPGCIVVELGDGIIGGYAVDSLLDDGEIAGATAAVVFCAADFVGAWGGRELLARRGLNIDVMSGPVSDSRMGASWIESELGLPAANALRE